MADTSIGYARANAADAIHRNAPAWILAGALMLFALAAPALWNGFPLIFPDTGGYLDGPTSGILVMGRSAFYGLLLYAGVPFSFWPNVVFQSALIIWLIALTMRTNGLGGRPWLTLGIVATLAVCTSLAVFASQLMPDILFPAAVLALYLLIFRFERLARWERFLLAATIAFAIASHMAAAGMCVAIIVAVWLSTLLKPLVLAKPRMTFAAGSVAFGIALCPIANLAITGHFAFTPGGASFLFGRLVKDGIVGRYLEERCPDPALRLCEFKSDLSTDATTWLWDDDSPFRKLGGWKTLGAEELAITWATFERYPLMQISTALVDAATQFLTFRTEIDDNNNAPTIKMFYVHFPHLFARFMRARQQTQTLDVTPLNYLHWPVAAVSLAGLGVALLLRRRLKIAPEAAALCLVILLALAANAAICGFFSDPTDRYQSRLVWLAPLAMALLIAHWRSAERTASASPAP